MKKLFILLSVLIFCATASFATILPDEVTQYIKEQVPKATIRFDGMVTYPDNTTYLPLIPAMKKEVEKLSITYSYPNKSDLKKKAEIIVFNNNYVLLKVIKEKNGSTFSKISEYPMSVKTGVLPQDLLVPKGLYVPEALEGILGDLKVPVGPRAEVAEKKEEENKISEADQFLNKKIPVTAPKIDALKNKLYFVSNYDSNYIKVINSNDSQPLYALQLSSIPRSIVPANNGKYLIISTSGKTFVDIVDIQREEIAKQVDLTIEPDEIVIDNKNNFAYVGSKNEASMFVIDIKTMELKQKVMLQGTPINMAINNEGTKIVYQDKNTTKLFVVDLEQDYENTELISISNISKIIATDDAVYAISRTRNKLYVIAYPVDEIGLAEKVSSPVNHYVVFVDKSSSLPAPFKNLLLAQTAVSQKPVDMLYYKDKLFILGAKQNQLDVYDIKTNKISNKIDLPMSGFSKKLVKIGNTSYVVIANAYEEKYLIFDLDTLSTIQQVPVNTKINNMVILQKTQPMNSKKENL